MKHPVEISNVISFYSLKVKDKHKNFLIKKKKSFPSNEYLNFKLAKIKNEISEFLKKV